MGLKTRLTRNPVLHEMYIDEMDKLITAGHAERVYGNTGYESNVWYLPHHPVTSPNKPGKVRIVYDCAATHEGIALNQRIHQGPDLTNQLYGILLRFREGKVAVTADIEAMFHQVFVKPADRDVLRFLWWRDGDLNTSPATYRMTVHLFWRRLEPFMCRLCPTNHPRPIWADPQHSHRKEKLLR